MIISDDIQPFYIISYYYKVEVYIITYIFKKNIDRNSGACDPIRTYGLSVRPRPWNNKKIWKLIQAKLILNIMEHSRKYVF